MTSVLTDHLVEPSPFILGILGQNNQITEQDLQDRVLVPILQDIGRVPEKILLSCEGNSSIYVQEWAETLRIITQLFHCDWARNGKMAQILRDDRIQKECTHLLVFLGPRSTRLEKLGERMAKKGKIVFTLCRNQILTKIECSPCASPVSGRVRKSNTQKEPPHQ